ncbi:unnamed protein product [Cylicocyclus nassatus]|uniref:Uncharacterized protein n=1 Tax=Cylicocyclus nassatus TaxID=53992 RepID=A0AA36H683_CYLNA|nr:unnamed protein product [Cylicocyclus nassatus]
MTALIALFFILTVQAALAFDDPWRAVDEENDDMMADPLGPSFESGSVIHRTPKIVKRERITVIKHHPMRAAVSRHFFKDIPYMLHNEDLTDGLARKKRSVQQN